MSNVDGPPESPSIAHVEPRPQSRISSTQLAKPVDHLFFCARYPPPPRKQASSGLSPVHQKRLSVHQRRWPVHPSLSPTMFEVVPGDFRWHLRSKHRGPRGRSGDIWAEHLLRWLGEGGATGRRRSRSRSSIFKGDAVEHLSVTLDSPHDRGAFQLRNVPLALIVEGGSAEVA